MKNVKVYGPGCKNCTETERRVKEVAVRLDLQVDIEKVSDLEQIMTAGVMNTPGITIDAVLKHSGSVPSTEAIEQMLTS